MNHFAKHLRHNATDPERRLWSRLRNRQLGGFRFRRQRPIGNYICDFVCLSESVVVELDGSQGAPRDRAGDDPRSLASRRDGWALRL